MYGSSEAGAILGKATVRILGGGLSSFCFLVGHMANLLEVLLLEFFPAECSLPSCGETYRHFTWKEWQYLTPRPEKLWREFMYDNCRSFTSLSLVFPPF